MNSRINQFEVQSEGIDVVVVVFVEKSMRTHFIRECIIVISNQASPRCPRTACSNRCASSQAACLSMLAPLTHRTMLSRVPPMMTSLFQSVSKHLLPLCRRSTCFFPRYYNRWFAMIAASTNSASSTSRCWDANASEHLRIIGMLANDVDSTWNGCTTFHAKHPPFCRVKPDRIMIGYLKVGHISINTPSSKNRSSMSLETMRS